MSLSDSALKVLIVDDNPEDLATYQRFFRKDPNHSYQIYQACSGEEAQALYHSTSLDCLLVDYMLPDTDGLSLLNELKKNDRFAPPIIMLTGQGNEDVVIKAMRAGAADYLSKRLLSVEVLRRAVTNAVEKHRLRSKVREKHLALEKANQELLRKNSEIQSFYHSVSHELKTPLTSALEFVSIVLDGLAGPVSDQQREYLDIAKESCEQMRFCINDLIDSTRIETGKLRISTGQYALSAVVDSAIRALTLKAKDKGIDLISFVQQDVDDVFIDKSRINQVITNLVTNALKFTDAGGHVTVRVNGDPKKPEYIQVSVSDSGKGIEPQKLDRIFDRLYQVDNEVSSSQNGLGLGLYISREIVHLHGGHLGVESTPEMGSTFWFTIPMVEQGEMLENIPRELAS
ncbi:MAG: hybrid sensor histidine kinase/response regulator [Gammaproteobacteria bacterium]|nr:hybrid sensor histidine kinase/response regulator [Gammaproteobacteria bacterium]